MVFKCKKFDYEFEFDGYIDLNFWALPFSILWTRIDNCRSLEWQFVLIFRFCCLQVSLDIWKWGHEITDVGGSIEGLFDER